MRTPRANDSAAARHLREAAMAFASHAKEEPRGEFDVEGQKRNRALLAAAIEYTRVCDQELAKVRDPGGVG